MDNFDLESIDTYIKKYKANIVNKLNITTMNENTITNNCDDICMVLDYSPQLKRRLKYNEKYEIESNTRTDLFHIPVSNLSLNLENKISPEDFEEDEQEEGEDEEGEDNDSGDDEIEEMPLYYIKQKDQCNNNNKEDKTKHNRQLYSLSVKENKVINKRINNSYNPNDQIRLSERDTNENEVNSQQESTNQSIPKNITNNRFTYNNPSTKEKYLLYEGKIRVYVLNTEKFIEFEISTDETFKQLKKRVLDKLELAANFSLEHHKLDAYEFRLINEYGIVIFDELPIDESDSVILKKENAVAFLEKQQAIGFNRTPTKYRSLKLIGNVISSSEIEKLNLKIYIKLDVNNPSSTILQLSSESTLKNVIEILAEKSRIPYKNANLYYITEHQEMNPHSIEKKEDYDEGMNVDLQLKNILTFEIDPSWQKYSMTQKVFTSDTNKRSSVLKDLGRESLFNTKTALQYREFEVLKVKKSKIKQDRMLGIDQYYLYNELPRKRNNQLNILSLLNAKIKHPLRNVRDIIDCGMISNKAFFIEVYINREEDTSKKLFYEVSNVNMRNEIINKVKYLIKIIKEKDEGID